LGGRLALRAESEKPQLSPRLDADFINNIQRIRRLVADSACFLRDDGTPSHARLGLLL
jgi:hypothetical protein